MAGEWKIISLDVLYEFSSGLSKPRSAFGSGYPFLSFKEVFYNIFLPKELAELVNSTEQERQRCSIKRGDVFLTRTSETMDELGMSCVALRDVPGATFNGFTKRLRPKSDETVVPEYAGYFFRSPTFRRDVTAMSSLSTRASLNNEMLARLSITLPPSDEQTAIGHILGKLDDKIELNRRMNETLEAMARALFKSWFVDFDPVRAKADGRAPGLPKTLSDLFPARLVDSDLGEIPEGWEVAELGDIAYVIDCLHAKKPERRDTGRPLLQLNNIRDDGLIDMEETYYIDQAEYKMWISRMEATKGDCVITNVGRVGAVAQIPDGLKAALGRNMTGIRCKPSYPFPTFLIECLLSEAIRAEIMKKMDAGTILNALNVRNIPRLRFVLPSNRVMAHFEQINRPLRQKMEQNLHVSRTLADIRNVLLPKLISGELRIKDAEKVAEVGS